MGAVVTGLTIVFLVIEYEKWTDVLSFGMGIVFYGSINLIGNALQAGNTGVIIYITPMPLVFILLLVMKRLSGQRAESSS